MRNVSRLVDLNSAGSALNWPSHSGLISSSGSQLGLGVQIARYARSFWSSASNVSTLCSQKLTWDYKNLTRPRRYRAVPFQYSPQRPLAEPCADLDRLRVFRLDVDHLGSLLVKLLLLCQQTPLYVPPGSAREPHHR